MKRDTEAPSMFDILDVGRWGRFGEEPTPRLGHQKTDEITIRSYNPIYLGALPIGT